MAETLAQIFGEVIPAELTVFIISLMPVLELRGGLVAAKVLGVDLLPAMLIGFIGTILPTPFILLFIRKIFDWMRNTKLVKLVDKLEAKGKSKFAEIEKYEKPWALTGTGCKREHNIVNSLYLQPDELEVKNFERYERYKIVEENEPMWEEYMMEDAELCVVAFGIASRVAKNAVVAARNEGIKVGLIRPITLWPFPTKPLAAAADKVKAFISVELNMGQMIEDVRLATGCKKPVTLCNRTGGMIPSPDQVLDSIRKAEKGEF